MQVYYVNSHYNLHNNKKDKGRPVKLFTGLEIKNPWG